MAKTNPLGFRLEPEVKNALVKAAEEDMRSVSSYVEKLIVEHLKKNGFLKDDRT